MRLGAELRVADPHSGHPGSLLTQLEPLVGRSTRGWVAETPRETLMRVDRVAEQLEQRKAGWRRHNGEQRPAWMQLMAIRRRKTLVIDRPCHEDVHVGRTAASVRK